MNVFYRMASRRGLPEEIYSDNGINLKGADNELKSLVSQLDEGKIKQSIANSGVKWNLNPSMAPHFGGVHESMIKSSKRAVKEIFGNTYERHEKLLTAIIWGRGSDKLSDIDVSDG